MRLRPHPRPEDRPVRLPPEHDLPVQRRADAAARRGHYRRDEPARDQDRRPALPALQIAAVGCAAHWAPAPLAPAGAGWPDDGVTPAPPPTWHRPLARHGPVRRPAR